MKFKIEFDGNNSDLGTFSNRLEQIVNQAKELLKTPASKCKRCNTELLKEELRCRFCQTHYPIEKLKEKA